MEADLAPRVERVDAIAATRSATAAGTSAPAESTT